MRVDRHNVIVFSVYSLQKVKRVGLKTVNNSIITTIRMLRTTPVAKVDI